MTSQHLLVIAIAAAIVFGSIYLLWIFYLAVMNLARARDAGQLSKTARVLGTPVLYIGWAIDLFCNVVPMTLLFLELPHETTVTARLKRHVAEGTGWRYRIAAWFAPILDPYDPSGHHITEEPIKAA